jgi:hypothetical protein
MVQQEELKPSLAVEINIINDKQLHLVAKLGDEKVGFARLRALKIPFRKQLFGQVYIQSSRPGIGVPAALIKQIPMVFQAIANKTGRPVKHTTMALTGEAGRKLFHLYSKNGYSRKGFLPARFKHLKLPKSRHSKRVLTRTYFPKEEAEK